MQYLRLMQQKPLPFLACIVGFVHHADSQRLAAQFGQGGMAQFFRTTVWDDERMRQARGAYTGAAGFPPESATLFSCRHGVWRFLAGGFFDEVMRLGAARYAPWSRKVCSLEQKEYDTLLLFQLFFVP